MPLEVLQKLNPLKHAADAFNRRTERKAQQDALAGQLALAKQSDDTEITVKVADLDAARIAQQTSSWKDEYITVSIITILNLVVIGGLAQAFGYDQVLNGIVVAIKTMNEVGVDVGHLLQVTVYAGLGLTAWNRLTR